MIAKRFQRFFAKEAPQIPSSCTVGGKRFLMSNSRRSWVVGALLSTALAACGSDSKTPTDDELPPTFSGDLPNNAAGAS